MNVDGGGLHVFIWRFVVSGAGVVIVVVAAVAVVFCSCFFAFEDGKVSKCRNSAQKERRPLMARGVQGMLSFIFSAGQRNLPGTRFLFFLFMVLKERYCDVGRRSPCFVAVDLVAVMVIPVG